jgi:hypothetical protein
MRKRSFKIILGTLAVAAVLGVGVAAASTHSSWTGGGGGSRSAPEFPPADRQRDRELGAAGVRPVSAPWRPRSRRVPRHLHAASGRRRRASGRAGVTPRPQTTADPRPHCTAIDNGDQRGVERGAEVVKILPGGTSPESWSQPCRSARHRGRAERRRRQARAKDMRRRPARNPRRSPRAGPGSRVSRPWPCASACHASADARVTAAGGRGREMRRRASSRAPCCAVVWRAAIVAVAASAMITPTAASHHRPDSRVAGC